MVLLGKNREKKYSGSYEQIAKIIYAVTTDKINSMSQFYKTVVMNYLLKNGDAHLKNFGILYDNDFKKISYAPAYDIVNTVAYVHRDKPALTMFGKKVWWGKDELAKMADISRVTLGKLERGQMGAVSIRTLDVILHSLNHELSITQRLDGFGIPTLDEINESE